MTYTEQNWDTDGRVTIPLFPFIKSFLDTGKMTGGSRPIQCRCRRRVCNSLRGGKHCTHVCKKFDFFDIFNSFAASAGIFRPRQEFFFFYIKIGTSVYLPRSKYSNQQRNVSRSPSISRPKAVILYIIGVEIELQ